jgi:hypothetical protein
MCATTAVAAMTTTNAVTLAVAAVTVMAKVRTMIGSDGIGDGGNGGKDDRDQDDTDARFKMVKNWKQNT